MYFPTKYQVPLRDDDYFVSTIQDSNYDWVIGASRPPVIYKLAPRLSAGIQKAFPILTYQIERNLGCRAVLTFNTTDASIFRAILGTYFGFSIIATVEWTDAKKAYELMSRSTEDDFTVSLFPKSVGFHFRNENDAALLMMSFSRVEIRRSNLVNSQAAI